MYVYVYIKYHLDTHLYIRWVLIPLKVFHLESTRNLFSPSEPRRDTESTVLSQHIPNSTIQFSLWFHSLFIAKYRAATHFNVIFNSCSTRNNYSVGIGVSVPSPSQHARHTLFRSSTERRRRSGIGYLAFR